MKFKVGDVVRRNSEYLQISENLKDINIGDTGVVVGEETFDCAFGSKITYIYVKFFKGITTTNFPERLDLVKSADET
jgi:hypothetical protein